jgi:hypothetical protein
MPYPSSTLYPGPLLFPGAGAGDSFQVSPARNFSGDAPEDYRVFAYDINTNTLMCELDAIGLQFGYRLNDAGPLQFDVLIDTYETAAASAQVLSLNGSPFACYVDLNGSIVWGGVAWTTDYKKSAGTVGFGGQDWFSWLGQRKQAASYDTGASFTPPAFIQKVILDAQAPAAGAGASVGLQVATVLGTAQPSMVPSYPASQRTPVAQMVQDMTKIMLPTYGGVDITLSSVWGPAGVPVNTLTVWTPRAGRQASNSSQTLELDNSMDYAWPTDAMRMGTNLDVTGGGTGTSMLSQTVQGIVPVGGLGQAPRLDRVVNYPAIQSKPQLVAMSGGAAQQYGQPLVTPTVTMPTRGLLGTFIVGDDVRVRTPGDPRFPSGYDDYWQVVAYDVNVPEDGVPHMVITLNPPPLY